MYFQFILFHEKKKGHQFHVRVYAENNINDYADKVGAYLLVKVTSFLLTHCTYYSFLKKKIKLAIKSMV